VLVLFFIHLALLFPNFLGDRTPSQQFLSPAPNLGGRFFVHPVSLAQFLELPRPPRLDESRDDF
ncbi:hypothetical protein, partial [Mesorhizobium opportunistum]|uniref:hypothetical protein n=1 Tax=Mesorhizobium opportunistum TaxID=593909 RepID=UPI003338295E